jgi:aconitate hydratase
LKQEKKKPIDLPMIEQFYKTLPERIQAVQDLFNRPLTYAEKVLYAHQISPQLTVRGKDYANFAPDRVAMQDATAQMALLQFMTSGRNKVAVPSTVHCDHLILAASGAKTDLFQAQEKNKEVYDFLQSVSAKYGIGFWGPGSGIIHQVLLENYAFPGGMMIGTDSHTPNAGGLGMIAIGVGGADAMDVMAGMPWELKAPRIIGVKLTGSLNGWTSAKDVILYLAGKLTVKGGTDRIVEYFGDGAATISTTGKGTICNMGAEIGATCSIFAYDKRHADYLCDTGRAEIAEMANSVSDYLRPDAEVITNPELYYDEVIEINLTTLEPHVNGPFTPDFAIPISQLAEIARENNWPLAIDVALIGSCTNSSFEDIGRAYSIANQAWQRNTKFDSEFIITPGSEMVRIACTKANYLDLFQKIGGVVMANACGPCIGQWNRHGNNEKNTIVTSFNRNFKGRNDGNDLTHAFVASPEIVVALALAGRLDFNPLTDELTDADGNQFKLTPPFALDAPENGYTNDWFGYIAPPEDNSSIDVIVSPSSDRLQLLEPFDSWDGNDFAGLSLLIKVAGKCTTDTISPAGKWLQYRGHLNNISFNLLSGAINTFYNKTGHAKYLPTGEYDTVAHTQMLYKQNNIATIVVGEGNYGEGSSREHAAMEPRYLGVKAIVVKSFARIHETNLKKQGMLALTFANLDDYSKVLEDDLINITGLTTFTPGVPLTMELLHKDGSSETIELAHSYNEQQIEWFKAGSALNALNRVSA